MASLTFNEVFRHSRPKPSRRAKPHSIEPTPRRRFSPFYIVAPLFCIGMVIGAGLLGQQASSVVVQELQELPPPKTAEPVVTTRIIAPPSGADLEFMPGPTSAALAPDVASSAVIAKPPPKATTRVAKPAATKPQQIAPIAAGRLLPLPEPHVEKEKNPSTALPARAENVAQEHFLDTGTAALPSPVLSPLPSPNGGSPDGETKARIEDKPEPIKEQPVKVQPVAQQATPAPTVPDRADAGHYDIPPAPPDTETQPESDARDEG